MSLAELKARKQKIKEQEEARNRPKVNWLTELLGADPKKPEKVDVVEVVFRQELDEEALGYNAETGKCRVAVEHHGLGQDGFKKRANCTLESEGQCYACERRRENWEEGWKQMTNFYINVAARPAGTDDEWKPYILTRNFNASFVDQLMMEAEDENTITDKVFRITKSGAKTTTAWTPKRLKEDAPDVSHLEFFDIEEAVLRNIPYAEQRKWYLGDSGAPQQAAAADEEVAVRKPASSDDDEW